MQYQERLYWHIRRIVLTHQNADDVLQETFIKIFRNIDGFKEESKLYSWMYRIATNEALSFLKRNSKIQGISGDELQNNQIVNLKADPYFDGDQAALELQKALLELPEKQRLVFNMKYFQELKYDEISAILETSVGALKASYHLAVKKIEKHLKHEGLET
jgi:RNA polymerase sigma-70 factor (ECF subfamily)